MCVCVSLPGCLPALLPFSLALAGLKQFPWEKPELTEKQKKAEEKRQLKKQAKQAKRRGD